MDLDTYKSNLKNMNYKQIVSILVNDVNQHHLTPMYRQLILDRLTEMNKQFMSVDDDIINDIVSNIGSDEYEDPNEVRQKILQRLKKSSKIINNIQNRTNN